MANELNLDIEGEAHKLLDLPSPKGTRISFPYQGGSFTSTVAIKEEAPKQIAKQASEKEETKT